MIDMISFNPTLENTILNMIIALIMMDVMLSFTTMFRLGLTSKIITWLLLRGTFTGNKYKKIDGKMWVKHPNSDWELLDEHTKKQKKLRDNK